MLTGPTGGGDYFGEPWKGGFPTPNESSLRTGLTPGGGGSMFPAPSPNSQALFNSLQSGGATPNTSEFYRAALKMNNTFGQNVNPPTSQPAEQGNQPTSDSKQFPAQAPSNQQPPQGQPQQDPFGQHDANVVTSLLGLSRADAQQNSNNQFAMPGQPSHVNTNVPQMGTQSQEASPTTKRAGKNSVTSMSGSADTGEFSESAHSEDAKPARSRGGKKAANGKNQASNGRRKADDGAVKGPASKKAKTNSGNAAQSNDDEDDSEDDNVKQEGGENNNNGKKMTDEEKRKNFLERNRYSTTLHQFREESNGIQGCGAQVSSKKEAMARQPAGQGRAFQHGERRSLSTDHAAPRGNCQSQDYAPRTQGLPGITGSRHQRHGYDQLHWRHQSPCTSIWNGNAPERGAAHGHGDAATAAGHAEEVRRSLQRLFSATAVGTGRVRTKLMPGQRQPRNATRLYPGGNRVVYGQNLNWDYCAVCSIASFRDARRQCDNV